MKTEEIFIDLMLLWDIHQRGLLRYGFKPIENLFEMVSGIPV